MSEITSFCQFCGAPLAASANFCEACGQPVKKAPPAQPVQPAPAPAQPYTPPSKPARKGNSALPIVLGGIGCLVLLCIVAMVVAIVFFLRNRDVSSITDLPQIVEQMATPVVPDEKLEVATQIPLPTFQPVPTQQDQPAPSVPQTVPGEFTGTWSADVGQERSSTYFADNFSSNQFDWADVDDDTRAWAFQDGHYQMHLKTSDYIAWAYLPVDFAPLGVAFDAALPAGFDQGAYGVLCYYQDQDNYHYVAVDVINQEYAIGKYVNNEDMMLMDDWWKPTQHLQDSPNAVNHVQVICLSNKIALYINGQLETEVSIDPATPGTTAIYAETWEDMPADGLKVQFDNLTATVEQP